MTRFTIFVLFCAVQYSVFAQDQIPEKDAPTFLIINQDIQLSEANTLITNFIPSSMVDGARGVTSFSESERVLDDLGHTHVTYQQYYEGFAVDGYLYMAHGQAGKLKTISGAFAKTGDVATIPTLTEEKGLNQALVELDLRRPMWESASAPDGYNKPHGELVIFYNSVTEQAGLAYKYDLYTEEPLYRAWVYVSATTGKVLGENLRIHHVNTPMQASSEYNGTVTIEGDLTNGTYSLKQTTMGGGVETYSLNSSTNYNNAVLVTDNGLPFNSDATAVQAHLGAEQTWTYFNAKHGRNSYDDAGSKLLSYVHYDNNYVNAFWDGSRMTYGDGDGTNYSSLTALDIAGHEMGHGVTEFSADLAYRRESGALNESFSDIFGEMVEYDATGSNNWLMGHDIGIGGSGAFRSMSSPGSYGDPDTYGGTNWTNPNCGTPTNSNDYCGVHSNSGVQNKWFYILAIGESGTNDLGDAYAVTGIGRTAASEIAYRNLTTYLSVNSTFSDARTGAIQSAIDLFGAGSNEEIATTDAWYAVGVGLSYANGGGGGLTCITTSDTVSLTLVTDNYASESSWTLEDSLGVIIEFEDNLTNATTYDVDWALANGTYTFTISDTYGDGICCGYGQGSYEIFSDTTSLGSGGNFTYSESVVFCVDHAVIVDTISPSDPTALIVLNETNNTIDLEWTASTDNVGVAFYEVLIDGILYDSPGITSLTVSGLTPGVSYTFAVRAVDAAGNASADVTVSGTTTGGGPNPEILLESYFETGWDGWLDGGQEVARYFSPSRSYEGSYAIWLRDNRVGQSSMSTASGYDLTNATEVEFDFYYYPYQMEAGKDFWVQYNPGDRWRTIGQYISGRDFNNFSFYNGTIVINSTNQIFTNDVKFRIRCDAWNRSDLVYVDAITITKNPATSIIASRSTNSFTAIQTSVLALEQGATQVELQADFDGPAIFQLSPNPASDRIQVTLPTNETVTTLSIFSATGQLMQELRPTSLLLTVELDSYSAGLYMLVIQTDEGETHSAKFVVE